MATFKHDIVIKNTIIKATVFEKLLVYKDRGSVMIDYNTGNIFYYVFKPQEMQEVEITMYVKKSDYENFWVLMNDAEVWEIRYSNTKRASFYKKEISKVEEYPGVGSPGRVYIIKARGYITTYSINVL